jgi:cephalosporin hydroxylase
MNPYERFKADGAGEVAAQGADHELREASRTWLRLANGRRYSYHFEWLGRPIIQYPQDIVAMQELIWMLQPDLIVETGIAHGGSLILWASLLELNAACGGPQNSRVIGIDIDIRQHNRDAIESHPMSRRITMIEGSSVDGAVVRQVQSAAVDRNRVLICLDSNHTHDHVLAELEAYAPLTSVGSYCVVFDTVIQALPPEVFPDRPWGVDDNPSTAVREYLRSHPEFEPDQGIDHKLLISVAPGGYLKRTRR